RVRKSLGDPLFVRTPSGMLPTPRCTEVVECAVAALSGIDETVLHRKAFDPASSRRDFVVTMADVGELHFAPPLMAHLEREAPLCNLRCETFPLQDIEAALEEGRCDLALGFFPNLERPALYAQTLFMHTLVCLVRANHPEIKSSRSEEHTSELQSRGHLVCRLLLEKKNQNSCWTSMSFDIYY